MATDTKTTDTKTTDDKTKDQTDQKTSDEKPQDFATWLEAQDEPTQELYEEHISGLKSALDSERETGRRQEKKLREAASAAEEGSEVRAKLEEFAADAETAGAQADFFEAAHAAGVADLRLAWLAVQESDSLRDRSGKADFVRLKEQHPALFSDAKKLPAGHPGAGASPDAPKTDVNTNLRKAAGR